MCDVLQNHLYQLKQYWINFSEYQNDQIVVKQII